METGHRFVQGQLPFVGRERPLALLHQALSGGGPQVVFLSGDRGVGKSRLAAEVARLAEDRDHVAVIARAFPLGTGGPYSLFSESFTPLIRELDESALQVLTRGSVDELALLFPVALPRTPAPGASLRSDEHRTRAFWAFVELLKNLAERAPLLIVLEDLHWADPESLRLLHFVARQAQEAPLVFLCTYAESEPTASDALRLTESSLIDLGLGRRMTIGALGYGDTVRMLEREFAVEPGTLSGFAGLLYGWTRGIPWLIDALLNDLRDSGRLRKENGNWHGWDIDEIRLPQSVLKAMIARFDRLSRPARSCAEVMAVMGTRVRLDDLESLEELGSQELLSALDELRSRRLVEESEGDGGIVFRFTHPVLRQTLRSHLGLARRRNLHGKCARVLEQRYGFAALSHAAELAHHFSEADPKALGRQESEYLASAGRMALAQNANAEAEKYLSAALGVHLRSPRSEDQIENVRLLLDLGRAQQRLGKTESAAQTFQEALGNVSVDAAGAALTSEIRRRIGLIHFGQRRHQEAVEQFEAGLQVATAKLAKRERAEILVAMGTCLHEVGRLSESLNLVGEADALAAELGDVGLQSRVARAYVLHYSWGGPARLAREYGERALALAEKTGEARSAFWAHWGLAISAAMTGEAEPLRQHLAKARALTDELGSPALKAWLAELAVELYYATGEWDRGLALAESAINVSRTLNQTALTVRLLVLAGIIHLERGDFDRGSAAVREAWTMAESAKTGPDAPADFFMVIPAHVGKAACALWEGNYQQAVDVGEAGIALAEGSGYQAWTIHRLLPIVAEGHLLLRNIDAAARVGDKLRELSERLDHTLGLAWASACEAVVNWLRGDSEQGAVQLREAAEVLEAIPMIPYAARIRRQLAGRLAETGKREAAIVELRRVHNVFSKLGAQGELSKTREMFREVDARPPRKTTLAGVEGLTGRELEIGRLVSQHLSNKAIGKSLDISPRTVSTHISNIFKKLGVSSRGELGEVIRQKQL